MFSISQDFAPPFKLIAPFFILGGIFYFLSVLYLFTFSNSNFLVLDTKVFSLVHLFLLGFVMMIIFGAMAQLVPVVLEVGHFAVELFYAIWPLLFIGTTLMAFGFAVAPVLLPFGGVIVFVAMSIFVVEIFLTIKKVKKLNIVMASVLISNIFLLLGIIVGFVMSLGYAGIAEVDVGALLKSHVFLVVGGYISIALMGLSVVLLPMFGLSHGFSKKPLEIAIGLMGTGVISVALSSFTGVAIFEYLGYLLATVALFVYFYLVFTIYKTRARKEIDVYVKSLMVSYFSLIASLVLGLLYLFFQNESLILSSAWLLFFGFFGFAITGHMYKIVPFLVWFERFSPLVGKQKVPMLADMLPKNSASAQFIFCTLGVMVVAIAILLQDNMLLKSGASFLLLGAAAFLRSLFYMINFK